MSGLLDVLDEHREAVEYDLIRSGARLRDFPDNGVTWRDLWVLIRQAQSDSAIYKALNPEWRVTLEAQILREIEHTLRILSWQTNSRMQITGDMPVRLPLTAAEVAAMDSYEKPDSMDWDEAFHFLGWETELNE